MTGDRITHELTIGVGEKIYQKKERKSANKKRINSTNTVGKQHQYTEKHRVITYSKQERDSSIQQRLTCGPAIDLEAASDNR